MEKFRKFADPNGINPFIPEPAKITKRNVLMKLFFVLVQFSRWINRFQLIAGVVKTCFFFCFYLKFLIAMMCKELISYILPIGRILENIIVMFYVRIMLLLLNVYFFPYKKSKHNPDKSPRVIFSSQSSIIDWMILMYSYAPKFLWIVKSEDHTQVLKFLPK